MKFIFFSLAMIVFVQMPYAQDVTIPQTREEWSAYLKETKSTTDKKFHVILANRKKIDAVLGERRSKDKLMGLIYKAEIEPYVENNEIEPDWKCISKKIRKYGAPGKEIFSRSKALYYYNKKDYEQFAKFMSAHFKKYKKYQNSPVELNNMAFKVFQNLYHKKYLKAALAWTDRAIELINDKSPHVMDTKANLLYKMGYAVEAIQLEDQAIAVAKSGQFSYMAPELTASIEKMKSGKPTW